MPQSRCSTMDKMSHAFTVCDCPLESRICRIRKGKPGLNHERRGNKSLNLSAVIQVRLGYFLGPFLEEGVQASPGRSTPQTRRAWGISLHMNGVGEGEALIRSKTRGCWQCTLGRPSLLSSRNKLFEGLPEVTKGQNSVDVRGCCLGVRVTEAVTYEGLPREAQRLG